MGLLMGLCRKHQGWEKGELGLEGCCNWRAEVKQGPVDFYASSHLQEHRAGTRDCPSLQVPMTPAWKFLLCQALGCSCRWRRQSQSHCEHIILLPLTHILPPSLGPGFPSPPTPTSVSQCPVCLQPKGGSCSGHSQSLKHQSPARLASVLEHHHPQHRFSHSVHSRPFTSSALTFDCAHQPCLGQGSGHPSPACSPALWQPGRRHAAQSSLPFPSHSLGPIQHKVNF